MERVGAFIRSILYLVQYVHDLAPEHPILSENSL